MNYYKFARMVVDYSRTWLLRPIPNRKVFVTWNISRVNRSVEAAVFSSCQNKHTNKQTYKQRNIQTKKQANKQTNKQASKQTNTYLHLHLPYMLFIFTYMFLLSTIQMLFYFKQTSRVFLVPLEMPSSAPGESSLVVLRSFEKTQGAWGGGAVKMEFPWGSPT